LADVQLHIGFDDTDSPRMGCTTYIGAILVERLEALGCKFTDYPNLIRLNPNVPWKTRGNGAVCLRVSCEDSSVDKVKGSVLETVKTNSDLEYARTDPAVVFIEGDF
jgi:tRNA(Ile2)-agmatinylcytidine synthase